jgi:phage terminase large subunit-like protein
MIKNPKKKPHTVTKYAQDIIKGKIIANKWVRLACKRHLADDPEKHNSIKKCNKRGLWFDHFQANKVINFFPKFLKFYEGDFDGLPFILTPQQKFIIGSIFGWKNKDGLRRFKTAYIEAGKGSGKTPLAAGIGLYGLSFDSEPGAEIYAAATTREQAGILFRDARLYAEASDSLNQELIIDRHNIANPETNSFFRPVSSEHKGLDGKKPHMALIDEIHEHPTDLVVRKMSAGAKTRRQNLTFEITNAGYDRHSICFQHHEYTEKCDKCAAEGKTIPQDGCPNCDDWRNPKVWEKANPNMNYLGKPFMAYLKRQVAEAKAMPSQENIVKRLNFCCWTESITKWLPIDKWNACNFPVDSEALKGRDCCGGLDLSTNIDLTAWVMVFPPEKEDGLYEILCRFFLPEDNMMERVKRDKVPYDVWARQGYIKLTPGNIIDYAFIIEQIKQDMTDYQIIELAFDRWGSQKITTDLQELGFEIEGKRSLVQFGQGFASMSPPTKEVETMVLKGELAHGGNPVLAWNVSNVAIRIDPAENKKPDKEKSIERIDGAVALIMAIGRAMLRGGPIKSVYDSLTVEEIKNRLMIG